MNEFCCIWFEQTQRWIVLFPSGEIIDVEFPAIGYAVNAALERIGASESDFDCEEDTGMFYRYVRELI
ncbi:hypothetical protein P106B_24 [Rhizobium phage vB_RglS_P106B]|uniref:Uncharacterized protein n=1 Tax=Rhizobium phage vB_RglS_P106B TaxID=1458697 RepID=W6EC07_9CAUD|nr:hypothetical protein P106B_24 [Rhizobium phage vB_RglS_P106B]AHJ10707.1 hypothetical protein P106B_24 [Rhizobium phage vB_RglS_P106B]